MKIVHICLAAFYPDNYSYQENMLPKFHKQMGYDVEVIASTQSFDKNGKVCYLEYTGSYQNEYDIKVTRLPYKSSHKIWKKLKRYQGTYSAIEAASPDILFIHGCQFLDIDEVVRYLKQHRNVTVYVDNHADFSNSATNWISRNVLHHILWRSCAHRIDPYVTKFYGVLPSRVDFLVNEYRLDPHKCELLVMGADDDLVKQAEESGTGKKIREQYGIHDDDFLIVTGGKIDQWKMQTLLLMEAVLKINDPRIRLIVFGSIVPELKERMNQLTDNYLVQYAGWISSQKTYDYFAAADLAAFPGRHSVLWEQAAGQGVPLLVKDWAGTHHVDVGGNVRFLKNDSAEEIRKELLNIIHDGNEYAIMKHTAEEKGRKVFSYYDIARRCVES